MTLQIPKNINSIIRYNLEIYLFDHLAKIPIENHEAAKNAFNADIKRIAAICESMNYIPLSSTVIQETHKALYPIGYIQKSKDGQGKEFTWMIPGEYRTIILTSKETGGNPYSNPESISEHIDTLVASFNQEMIKIQVDGETNKEESSEQQKNDTITRFILDLVRIHPFGDGNGRIGGILSDILYLSHGLEPMGLLRCYKLHKIAFTKILTEGNSKKNLQKLYEFTEKNQE